MTREDLNKLRSLLVAFDSQAQKNFRLADSTMDEESEAYEKAGRSCAELLSNFIELEGEEQ
jgi:hypothetical protein